MRKRMICTLIALCMAIGMVPAMTVEASAIEPVPDAQIEARINELCSKLDGKYFNDVGVKDTPCGTKTRGHGCTHCIVGNVIKADWFEKMFGEIKNARQKGINLEVKSCMGFVSFARWYILKVDDNDSVMDKKDVKWNLDFDYETVSKNAHIGDYLRCGDGNDYTHSVIYISCDARGVMVLDCNLEGQYNCMVKKHVIPYSTYKKFNCTRSYSKAIGEGRVTTQEPPTTPQSIPDGLYTLAPACAPGSRLDIEHKSTSNGANAHIWKAYDDTSQIFSITAEGDGYYLITSNHTGKRLDVTNAKTSSGTNVQQWSANNNAAQRWAFEDAGDGYYYIVSKLTSGLCLDVNRGGSADGTNVQVWSKNNTASQKWKLTKVEEPETPPSSSIPPIELGAFIIPGTYEFAPACASDSRMDTEFKSDSDRANIHLWSAHDSESQHFTIASPVGGTFYTITSENSGKVLDVANGNDTSGTNVWQYRSNGSDSQLWGFQSTEDGYYYIIPKLNIGFCLDVNGGNSTDGTNIQVWDRNGKSSQKWKLIPVEKEPKLVNITVDFNGGDGAGVCWRREVGETYGSLPEATRDGYTLDGWYTSRRGGKRVTSSTRIDGEDEQITLYAHWTKEEPEVPPTHEPIKIPDIIPSHEPVEEPEVPSTPKPVDPPTPQTPEEPKGHWGPWSEWSEKKVTASDTRQVERREVEDTPAYTEYRYGKWGNPRTKQGHACKNLAQQYYGSVAELTTEWYSTRYSAEKDYKIFCGGKNHTHKGCFKQDGNDVWNRYIVDGVTYFWEESREVKATYKTQYRYRDWIEG